MNKHKEIVKELNKEFGETLYYGYKAIPMMSDDALKETNRKISAIATAIEKIYETETLNEAEVIKEYRKTKMHKELMENISESPHEQLTLIDYEKDTSDFAKAICKLQPDVQYLDRGKATTIVSTITDRARQHFTNNHPTKEICESFGEFLKDMINMLSELAIPECKKCKELEEVEQHYNFAYNAIKEKDKEIEELRAEVDKLKNMNKNLVELCEDKLTNRKE